MKRSLLARALIGASLLAALPFAASAQDSSGLNYNYVEGGYVATHLDDSNPDKADGWGLNGSVALAPNWHLFAGYTKQKVDDINVDISNARFGVGFNYPIGASTDLIARAAYENYDTNVSGADSQNGYSAEVGARSAFTDNFEGYAAAGYEDGNDFDGDFYGKLGAQVKFNPNWGISGDVKFADGDTQWFVGPRFSW